MAAGRPQQRKPMYGCRSVGAKPDPLAHVVSSEDM